MPELQFAIEFRGPFHVAHGSAGHGLDRTVDHRVPLPASSLKGVMRAEARLRLALPSSVIDEIFGRRPPSDTSPKTAGRSHTPATPWAWSDAVLAGMAFGRVNRIKLERDPALPGVVDEQHLMFGEHVWSPTGRFTIEQIAPLPSERRIVHEHVLRACARSVAALGGGRRRGEGWVSITPVVGDDVVPWRQEETRAVLALATDSTATVTSLAANAEEATSS